jgi:acetyl-CoA carboxylase carboxyltransferase component
VARQHAAGRLTIRERIARLVDPGSFHEIGKIAGRATYDERNDLVDLTPSNFVFGRGRIDTRPVVVGGDDFTVRGGSADATIKEKHHQCERMAHDLRLPLVRLVEGSGGGGSVKTIETTGGANVPAVAGWEQVVANMAVIPRVALGLGSVAGLGAAHLAAAHYSVMVKERSALFVAGPPVVERTGEKLSQQELGGWELQLKAGAVDDAVDSEDEAFARTRRFLSYLPSSIYALPPRGTETDDRQRREPGLADAVPRDRRKVYRMRPIVEALVDQGSFFEIAPLYGRSMITGLARLDGWPVALMASDPMFYGGAWTADTCQKVERFVDLAQTFHLPVVHLVDCPGFLIGSQAERTGTIKQGVRAMSAIWQTTVPWCAVIIRNVFGVAGAAHRNGGRYCMRYAWPSGRWGSLPLEGGIEAAYRAELDAAPDPKQKLAEIEERLTKLRSPFRSAETFWIEEIIDPRDTRPLLCEFATLAAPLREPGPWSHGMRP